MAVYVGLGFAPALHAGDPFVIAAVLAVAGLVIGALVISRSPANTAVQPQAELVTMTGATRTTDPGQ